MAGTKGWTEKSLQKMQEGGQKGGKRGHRESCECGWCRGGTASWGEDNPNWKGGVNKGGYGSGWKAARKVVWERDKVCQACGQLPDSNRRLDVHHIITRGDGGSNNPENLIGLHHICHMKVHAGKLGLPEIVTIYAPSLTNFVTEA